MGSVAGCDGQEFLGGNGQLRKRTKEIRQQGLGIVLGKLVVDVGSDAVGHCLRNSGVGSILHNGGDRLAKLVEVEAGEVDVVVAVVVDLLEGRRSDGPGLFEAGSIHDKLQAGDVTVNVDLVADADGVVQVNTLAQEGCQRAGDGTLGESVDVGELGGGGCCLRSLSAVNLQFARSPMRYST